MQFWSPEHTPKVTTFVTYVTSGENCNTALQLGADVARGLYRAPYCNAPPPTCTSINEIRYAKNSLGPIPSVRQEVCNVDFCLDFSHIYASYFYELL